MAYTTIDDPSAYFTTVLYTGTSDDSVKTVTNDANAGDFKPDWLWIKARSGSYATRDHALYDSNRGATKRLESNATDAEATDSNNVFNTNGFTLTSNYSINGPSTNYVGWQWKCNGGTTASNTDGSITSTVQANTTAGFSIVTYTGNGTEGATFGHGLGATPDLVIVKGRADADNWAVFNGTSTTNSRSLHLDTTDAEIPVSSYNFWNLYWDETRPSSTVVTLGVDSKVNKNSGTKVAYCFRSIQGYSKIGKYIGNGNANGTFVHLGFKPAWVMTKRTDTANGWPISDNARNPFNVVDISSYANSASDANTVSNHYDSVSNGFKLRGTSTGWNTSGGTYIYIAFAEHPFVSSKGVPTTAV